MPTIDVAAVARGHASSSPSAPAAAAAAAGGRETHSSKPPPPVDVAATAAPSSSSPPLCSPRQQARKNSAQMRRGSAPALFSMPPQGAGGSLEDKFRAATFGSDDEERDVKAGFLSKEGGMTRGWKKRWFVLTSCGNLKYYENERKAPIDTLPLGGCFISELKSKRAGYPAESEEPPSPARGARVAPRARFARWRALPCWPRAAPAVAAPSRHMGLTCGLLTVPAQATRSPSSSSSTAARARSRSTCCRARTRARPTSGGSRSCATRRRRAPRATASTRRPPARRSGRRGVGRCRQTCEIGPVINE